MKKIDFSFLFQNNYVPSAEYEPPNPSQDFNFEQFEDVTTKTDRLLAASAKLLEKNSSNSKKFRQNEDENSNSNLEKPLPLTKPVTMKDPVYFNPSVQKKFENLQSVVPFEFEDDSPKKFSNPPSFSFKTIPTEPEVVTDLPKYTYSVKTSTSVNAFINFGENNNAAADQQEEEELNNITENLPKFTYKVIHGEPKKYNYNILGKKYALKKFVKLHNSEKDIFLQQPIFVRSDLKKQLVADRILS